MEEEASRDDEKGTTLTSAAPEEGDEHTALEPGKARKLTKAEVALEKFAQTIVPKSKFPSFSGYI